MKLTNILKYFIRFFVLLITITYTTIYYFDRFLINEYQDGYLIIINNLIEDRDRFYTFVGNDYIKIDIYLAIFILIFLLFLYSSKFFTYVNELSFSLDKKFFDEYLYLYLIWTSSLMTFLFLFRFSVVSRFYLLLLTFIVPLILQIFRNTEIISSFLGRSVTNEKYITFNLDPDSIFRNLRILTFRENIGDYLVNLKNLNSIIDKIDSLNKKTEINLVVINISQLNKIPKNLEKYLLSLNKKVLLLSSEKIKFDSFFISKNIELNGKNLTYFNNDIQYGSKYIIKRMIDLISTFILLILFLPLFLLIAIFIWTKDGSPIIIKQRRVGLHGKLFNMYKFRTMYNDSHTSREKLKNLNKNDKVIFKIENDPRIFNGGQILRKYSVDELPQLLNVLKGDMSLVGPRPLFEEDTSQFDKNYMRRLNVFPGLTGLLQINERNTDKFEVWYKYDIEYINNWTIWLDLKILFKTPKSLFKNKSKGL